MKVIVVDRTKNDRVKKVQCIVRKDAGEESNGNRNKDYTVHATW